MKLEPLLWGIFSAGGTIAAFVLPIHIFLNNVAPQLGWISADVVSYNTMANLLSHQLVKIYIICTFIMMFYYAVHRFSFVPQELLFNISHKTTARVGQVLLSIFAVATLIIVIAAP
jgi:fumarate reductase subunit D